MNLKKIHFNKNLKTLLKEEYLQYKSYLNYMLEYTKSFKPCYIWTAFNTRIYLLNTALFCSFKPYYNWTAFNTK